MNVKVTVCKWRFVIVEVQLICIFAKLTWVKMAIHVVETCILRKAALFVSTSNNLVTTYFAE